MAARTGMANLIKRLRALTDTTTADYTLGGVAWWTDDQLQDVLDTYRTDLERVLLRAAPEYVDGVTVYYDYHAPLGTGDFEESTSGTEAWAVRDADGALIAATEYTPNYVNGHIRFDTNQAGLGRYLRARAYDLNRAAAQVWRQKAAHVALRYDIRTDNHDLKRSQMRQACLEMAHYYDGQAGPQEIRLVREDLL